MANFLECRLYVFHVANVCVCLYVRIGVVQQYAYHKKKNKHHWKYNTDSLVHFFVRCLYMYMYCIADIQLFTIVYKYNINTYKYQQFNGCYTIHIQILRISNKIYTQSLYIYIRIHKFKLKQQQQQQHVHLNGISVSHEKLT